MDGTYSDNIVYHDLLLDQKKCRQGPHAENDPGPEPLLSQAPLVVDSEDDTDEGIARCTAPPSPEDIWPPRCTEALEEQGCAPDMIRATVLQSSSDSEGEAYDGIASGDVETDDVHTKAVALSELLQLASDDTLKLGPSVVHEVSKRSAKDIRALVLSFAPNTGGSASSGL